MEVVHERCAGIDISKTDVKVCVRVPGLGRRRRKETRTFTTMTGDLLAMRDWLLSERITVVGIRVLYGPPVQSSVGLIGDHSSVRNAAGLLTGKGKPFTAGGVARVRDAYKIWAPRTVAVQDGEVSVKHAAAELGIPADAVYNWLKLGQVPARRSPGGRWCIAWDPATQEIYRQKVARSFRLKPVQPATAAEAE